MDQDALADQDTRVDSEISCIDPTDEKRFTVFESPSLNTGIECIGGSDDEKTEIVSLPQPPPTGCVVVGRDVPSGTIGPSWLLNDVWFKSTSVTADVIRVNEHPDRRHTVYRCVDVRDVRAVYDRLERTVSLMTELAHVAKGTLQLVANKDKQGDQEQGVGHLLTSTTLVMYQLQQLSNELKDKEACVSSGPSWDKG